MTVVYVPCTFGHIPKEHRRSNQKVKEGSGGLWVKTEESVGVHEDKSPGSREGQGKGSNAQRTLSSGVGSISKKEEDVKAKTCIVA